MHATIDVRFTTSIDEDKTVPPNPVERLMGEVSKRSLPPSTLRAYFNVQS